MGLIANFKRDLAFTGRLKALLKRVKPVQLDSPVLICDDFEAVVDKFPDRIAMEDERRSVTYRELDILANRFAHWAKGRNIRRGEVVALMMLNRIEYFAAWMGFSKVGVITALVNTNLGGHALAHSLNIAGASHVLSDEDCWRCVEDARSLCAKPFSLWVMGLRAEDEADARRGVDNPVRGASSVRPDRSLRAGLTCKDTALFIYTSGTTGLPKAAKVTHSRTRIYMNAFASVTRATEADRLFCVLPMYHATGGLGGLGSVLMSGGTAILRRKFSASNFWPDVTESRATLFVYIGELCRYLVNAAPNEQERAHKLRLAFGNGLRPDVWDEFKSRFAIPEIVEFYGSTEGNVSTFNFDGKAGSIGRVPKFLRSRIFVRLAAYDVEADDIVRGSDGLVREARIGEVGEAIGQVRPGEARSDFTGYADKAATEKKVLRDVFTKGDVWFRTGDLMRQDSEGYLFFVDRVGDTFRWKGENVSTTEVQERLSEAPNVSEAIAYGVPVPHQDGKAGMVGLVTEGRFAIKRFSEYAAEQLPTYAQPMFVRVIRSLETTGTFKYRKVDLVADGFDPDKVDGQLYVRGGKGGYVKLTPAIFEQIQSGEYRF